MDFRDQTLFIVTFSVPAGPYPNRICYTSEVRAMTKEEARQKFSEMQSGYSDASCTGWIIEQVESLREYVARRTPSWEGRREASVG